MRFRRSALFSIGVWGLATVFVACGQPAPPPPPATPFLPVVDVKLLMSGMTDPSADVVWQSVAIYIDQSGEQHKRPKNDEEWLNVQNHAMVLAESGNLLMISPRAKDDGDWMKLSRALVEVGTKAFEAAQKQDPEALLLVGGEIYDTCVSCHKKYLPPDAEDPI